MSLDDESYTRLKKLDGKINKLELLPVNIIGYLVFTHGGVCIKHEDHGHADITIRGRPSDVFALKNTNSLYHSHIKIIGDMGLAEELKHIFNQLELDWEGELAHYTGDIVAHRVSKAARGLKNWLSETQQDFQDDMRDYLQEESKLLPPRIITDKFSHEVAILRDDVERLAARINQLTTSN
ncbi:MAG: SCP2 sterol-binding domain-containing protein [Gammaproteobacteria bacterium]|nr:SCP2 sterol-binding domain-containing protein [Gammaproteobacteria bacterium]